MLKEIAHEVRGMLADVSVAEVHSDTLQRPGPEALYRLRVLCMRFMPA